VGQSGGDVRIESVVGRGTRVTLYLPRARAVSQSPSGRGKAAAPIDPLTILLVEDDDAVADVVRAQLEARGHRVIIAQDGYESLQRIGSNSAIDLVFSDIVMPGGMSGVDLAREIRKRRPELPILLTTGYSDTAGEAMTLGFPLLRKPYAGADLEAAIGACLRARRVSEPV
jgi:CheY-like chemotaxis protein